MSASPSSGSPAQREIAVEDPKRPSTRLPREADFWRLWLVGLVLSSVRWVETLAIAVFSYQVTGSAFTVTTLTMLRMLPMAMFGAFFGATTDRLDRRAALIIMLLTMMLTSLTVAILDGSGMLAVWHLGLASFISGIGWATENSLRRIMIGDVVGAGRMAAAMGLDTAANNASRVVAPTVGGTVLALAGIKAVFILGTLLYLVAIVAAIGIRHRNHIISRNTGSVFGRILGNLKVVGRDKSLSYFFAITAIFNIFGWPLLSLVPVIGKDRLQLGPEGVGLLASMEGVGAVIGAAAILLFAKPPHYALIYTGSVVVYLVMIAIFALMSQPATAGMLLVLIGFCGSNFSIMQSTQLYRAVKPEMRAPMMGLLSVCIGLGPLGFLQLGLLADFVGAQRAVVTMGLEGLAAMVLVYAIRRVGNKHCPGPPDGR